MSDPVSPQPLPSPSPQAALPPGDENDASMSFWEHLGELRRRITWTAVVFILLIMVSWFFREYLFAVLKQPIQPYLPSGSQLIYTAPAEMFFTYFKICVLAALFLGAPFYFYQLWAFVAPGLYPGEKRLIWPFLGCSAGLFMLGALFCYFVVLPLTLDFFMSMATEGVIPLIKVSDHFSFAVGFIVIFGLLFETPLVLVFLGKLHIITAAGLRKYRRYAILGAFVVAALATPSPDAINQILLALPLLVLYEFSIVLIRRMEKRREKSEPA
ncbi:MAG: twin-arginine translocase subunit TatC [Desulfarculales bacterium]|jgi:sec-independent protein translocase protein TatC|nr:twin-arginine translocase subunit TatC [Desulfarculales bacterium]